MENRTVNSNLDNKCINEIYRTVGYVYGGILYVSISIPNLKNRTVNVTNISNVLSTSILTSLRGVNKFTNWINITADVALSDGTQFVQIELSLS